MTSEIRVNKLQNRVGLGTVEYTNTGIVVSGIVTCTELSGLTALNIAGVGTANTLDINGDIDVDGHTELDNTNIVGLVTVTNVSSGIGLKLIEFIKTAPPWQVLAPPAAFFKFSESDLISDALIASVNVVTPATETLSKFVCPSTSMSPFMSAPVAVIIPAFPNLILLPTST